ncbi:DUF3152 domain-containing protein [uncultured Streptomyces sp.]|uniref:DUF3152 domain-containing protein n=1 Tax=uncultured Streptomyces sp. TaxID=174707 RepID=UPI00261670D8|nr:DUF3152 domain-containing protein [uncultured Streptomyces sp.]
MGRHSRSGPGAARTGSGADPAADDGAENPGSGRRRRGAGTAAGHGEARAPFPGAEAPGARHTRPEQRESPVRGGHPEQHEPGGGWGSGPPAGRAPAQTPPRSAPPGAPGRGPGPQAGRPAAGGAPLIPGPRREFVDAFDMLPPAPRRPVPGPAAPHPVRDEPAAGTGDGSDGSDDGARTGTEESGGKGGLARVFTGIAAAAVTTVLAVVVAGQVAQEPAKDAIGTLKSAGTGRDGESDASRSDTRADPESGKPSAAARPSYEQAMATPYPLAPDLKASGEFEAVPGRAKAPGTGQKFRYRIDVEKGLGLDAALFAQAVQKTLNDDRSWAHDGAMTFERVSSGSSDFVITLASPGTTGVWCAKSGLDTTVDNVSCDSAATERVMINAYRWAQGSATFGPDKLLPYRQMLINHEVGHRLGHNHVSCRTPGALAPVMQQQTKSLDIDGITCKPNPWAYPGS